MARTLTQGQLDFIFGSNRDKDEETPKAPSPPPKDRHWTDNVSFKVGTPGPDHVSKTPEERFAEGGGYTFGPGGHPIAHSPDGKGGYTSSPVVPGQTKNPDAAAYALPLESQLADLMARQTQSRGHDLPQAWMKAGEWQFVRDRIAQEHPDAFKPPGLDELQIYDTTGRALHGYYHEPTSIVTGRLDDLGVPGDMQLIMGSRAMDEYGLGQHASELSMSTPDARAIQEQRLTGYYGGLPSGHQPRYWDGTPGELNPLLDEIRAYKSEMTPEMALEEAITTPEDEFEHEYKYSYTTEDGSQQFTNDLREAMQKKAEGSIVRYVG